MQINTRNNHFLIDGSKCQQESIILLRIQKLPPLTGLSIDFSYLDVHSTLPMKIDRFLGGTSAGQIIIAITQGTEVGKEEG